MSLESLAQELYQMPKEERDPVRDSYELAKEFVHTYFKRHGLIFLVGETGVIIDNTTPRNGEDEDLPHDFLLEKLGYAGLTIYNGKIGDFLMEVDRGHPPEMSIHDLAIGIDHETGEVIGAKLYVEGAISKGVELRPGEDGRHIAAGYASNLDNIYAMAVSEERGVLTTFKERKRVPHMCYDPTMARTHLYPIHTKTELSLKTQKAVGFAG